MSFCLWLIYMVFQDSNSLKDHLIASQSHRSIRIANQQELQQRQQRKQQKINARRNSSSGVGSTGSTGGTSGTGNSGGGESGSTDEHPNSKTNNSPSPRTKHNRKQAKGIATGISVKKFSALVPFLITYIFLKCTVHTFKIRFAYRYSISSNCH